VEQIYHYKAFYYRRAKSILEKRVQVSFSKSVRGSYEWIPVSSEFYSVLEILVQGYSFVHEKSESYQKQVSICKR